VQQRVFDGLGMTRGGQRRPQLVDDHAEMLATHRCEAQLDHLGSVQD